VILNAISEDKIDRIDSTSIYFDELAEQPDTHFQMKLNHLDELI
jgi:hypothetical protein